MFLPRTNGEIEVLVHKNSTCCFVQANNPPINKNPKEISKFKHYIKRCSSTNVELGFMNLPKIDRWKWCSNTENRVFGVIFDVWNLQLWIPQLISNPRRAREWEWCERERLGEKISWKFEFRLFIVQLCGMPFKLVSVQFECSLCEMLKKSMKIAYSSNILMSRSNYTPKYSPVRIVLEWASWLLFQPPVQSKLERT